MAAKKGPESICALVREHFEGQLELMRKQVDHLERYCQSAHQQDLDDARVAMQEIEKILKNLGAPTSS